MSDAIGGLISALRCLPGVGPRSAQRMAYHLLLNAPGEAKVLSDAVTAALSLTRPCCRCGNLCDDDLCHVCSDTRRDRSQLCVVEMPYDLLAIEQSGAYRGCYFVLQGRLSPLDGIGPEQLNIAKLEQLCREGEVKEVIFALNTGTESDATVYYLMRRLSGLGLRFSQLAKGVPAGGVLEFLDASTIGGAMTHRLCLSDVKESVGADE